VTCVTGMRPSAKLGAGVGPGVGVFTPVVKVCFNVSEELLRPSAG
jgi:hypothetical protein